MNNRKPTEKTSLLRSAVALLLVFVFCLGGCGAPETESTTVINKTEAAGAVVSDESTREERTETTSQGKNTTAKSEKTETTRKSNNLSDKKLSLSSIPEYAGKAYVAVNENKPFFTSDEITTKAFEKYEKLDNKGRCRAAFACCGTEIMPKDGENRGSISNIKPTGWNQAKYDNVSGKYLYNRCHLIGWQLSAENANKRNLITGTKYLNIEGMLPFENMIADYIKETGNHVMYRVTPFFEENNLLASGVQIEAYSVEDDGDGICFNVYCYNVQPGIRIDYSTGGSSLASGNPSSSGEVKTSASKAGKPTTTEAGGGFTNTGTYILNTNTKKIHYPGCSSVKQMKDQNKESYSGSLNALLSKGYTKCGKCF